MEETNDYLNKVGSFDGDTSFKDIKKFVKEEVEDHEQVLEEACEDCEDGTREVVDGAVDTDQKKSNAKFYAYSTKESVSGIIVPTFDMGSDVATAVTHYKWGNYGWCALTLVVVALPGFVCGLAITIKGLRKKITAQRIVNYSIILLALPFLYPFIQVFVNAYMVYLMCQRKSHQVVKVMGSDVKQFKSLEGFLESGPQFVLQSYIILRGDKKGFEDFESVDAGRLAILCITVALSFISLTKTGYNVNVPDPDEQRKSPQNTKNVKRFWLTSIPFHFITVLFRVGCLAYFCANLSNWAAVIILFTMMVNMLILHYDARASPMMTILLGTVSVFLPNGYLLYNFAATFLCDFTFDQSKKYLFFHMLAVTTEFCLCVGIIWIGQVQEWSFIVENIPSNSVLQGYDGNAKYGFNVVLILLGATSLLLALIHWKHSIVPLYDSDNVIKNPEDEKEEQIELEEKQE